MSFSFKRTGDEDYPRFIKAVVQGSPKSGKTTLLSTFPNIVIADVEHEQGGLMSIAHKNVPYVEIDSSQTLRTLKTILADESLRAKAAAQLGMPKIESVAIDTLDEYQRILKKERLSKTKGKEFKRDDWGWLLEEMRAIINGFVALPINVVFTVHTKLSVIDEDTSIMVPALQGAIGDELPGMVGFALETTKRKAIDTKGNSFTQYQIQAEGDEKSPHLGNRAGGRLPRMIDPDFAVLHKAVYDGLKIAQATSVTFDAPEAGAPETPTEVAGTETPVESKALVDVLAPEAAATEAAAAGAPEVPPEEPISKGAIQHLQAMYAEFDQVLPPSVTDWTLAKGRDVARWVVSVKADLRGGKLEKGAAVAQVVEGLKGMDAWADPSSPEVTEQAPNDPDYTGASKDTVADVMDWVGVSESRAAEALRAEHGNKARSSLITRLDKVLEDAGHPGIPAPAASSDASEPEPDPEPADPEPEPEADPETETEPEVEVEPETEPEPEIETPVENEPVKNEHEEADLIKTELKGERIPDEELPAGQRPCVTCNKPSDDPELSELAEARHGKWLCVDCYLEETARKKKAVAANA